MRLVQHFLQRILDRIHRIPYWVRHMWMRRKYKTFNSLQRIPDAIVHPANGLELTHYFDHLPSLGQLPPKREQECQHKRQHAPHQPKRAVIVHPVVVNQPLQQNRNEKTDTAKKNESSQIDA